MKIFLQDHYLKGFGWVFFKEALNDKSINLSLYLDKFINESALLESPNKAKLFSLSLLKNYYLIEDSINCLIDNLNRLIDIVKTYGQDNKKTYLKKNDVLKELGTIYSLVKNGYIFSSIDFKKIINKVKDLHYKNFSKIKFNLYNIISSIDNELNKIQKCDTFDVFITENTLKEYEIFYKFQESLWTFKLKKYRINPDKFLKDLRLKTKSRLVIGLGDESVYETSIRLHRNYGVPYIPGSALKGVAKHNSILNLTDKLIRELKLNNDFFKLAKKVQDALENPATYENDEKAVEKAVKDKLKIDKIPNEIISEFKLLREIFGTQKCEGSVIFFDAFPTPNQLKDKPILELDIINPHYQPYYSASEGELKKKVEKAPGDWHQPNPIYFLTIPKGIEFQFAVAPRNDTELLNKAKEILISALREFGVGAKTSLGYGRFH